MAAGPDRAQRGPDLLRRGAGLGGTGPGGDRLRPKALARLAGAQPRQAEDELVRLRELRETAYAALVEQDEAAVDRLATAQREVLDRSRLTYAGGPLALVGAELTLATPRDRVAAPRSDLLTSPEVAALHQCEDPACGWVYLDTSPRRNRRWCIAADCGNRNRARRFYARRRAAQPTA